MIDCFVLGHIRPDLGSLFEGYKNSYFNSGRKRRGRFASDEDIEQFYADLFSQIEDDATADIENYFTEGEVRDIYGDVIPRRNRPGKRNRRTGKKGKKKNKGHINPDNIDVVYGYSDENVGGEKLIYFYPDYKDKHDFETFHSILEFDEFLKDEGINVPSYTAEDIYYNYRSFCCLDLASKEYGMKVLICGDTYNNMYDQLVENSYNYEHMNNDDLPF